MRTFIKEIQKQDRSVREFMFALSIITSFSLVGMIWFSSFQKNMYAILNEAPEEETKFFAQEESKNLFGYFKETYKDGKALIGNLFSRDSSESNDIQVQREEPNQNEVHVLPVSNTKE